MCRAVELPLYLTLAFSCADLNKAVRPYQDIYTRDVAPYLSQAYVYSLATGGTLYTTYVNQVHPTVVASLQQLHSFYINHVDPATRRAYSLYVRPQVERLLAKVFERKAHATGSEAIAQAKQEVKVAAKEGAARSEEKVVEAEKEALRKHEEPSVIEQAQQAAESLMGIKKDTGDDVDTARLDAELDAELEMVKEQLEAWESGMTKLIGQEYKLFTERISDLVSEMLMLRSRFSAHSHAPAPSAQPSTGRLARPLCFADRDVRRGRGSRRPDPAGEGVQEAVKVRHGHQRAG